MEWLSEIRTPPVECPLIVKLHDGTEVECIRNKWADSHEGVFEFEVIDDGGVIVGRYPWRHK